MDNTARRANVEGSIREHVRVMLASTFGSDYGAIDYGGGEPFDDTQFAEWLQVRFLERAQHFVGHANTTQMGRAYFVMLNLNIFVRPAKLATLNTLRLTTLADSVRDVFQPTQRIEVKNYAGDSASLGHLIVDDHERDSAVTPAEREQELQQWNLVVSLRWTELWTA